MERWTNPNFTKIIYICAFYEYSYAFKISCIKIHTLLTRPVIFTFNKTNILLQNSSAQFITYKQKSSKLIKKVGYLLTMWIMKEAKTTTQPQPPSGGGGMSLGCVMRGSTWGRHDTRADADTGTATPTPLLLTLQQYTTHTLTRGATVDVYSARHVPARPRGRLPPPPRHQLSRITTS